LFSGKQSPVQIDWKTEWVYGFNNNNNNNNNNNYYYYYLLQLGCHPVAVVILHVYKT